jgi:hypothetical protein
MKTLLKGYKFQSAEAMKNTSAGIEGCCYKKPTRILPTAVRSMCQRLRRSSKLGYSTTKHDNRCAHTSESLLIIELHNIGFNIHRNVRIAL